MKKKIHDLIDLGVDPAAATAVLAIARAVALTLEREADDLLDAGRDPAAVRDYIEARRGQLNAWLEAQLPAVIERVADAIDDLSRDDIRDDVREMIG
ncbi:hypothetical protein M1D80_09465 [Phyllobacteriaceae bacterium JZ32]